MARSSLFSQIELIKEQNRYLAKKFQNLETKIRQLENSTFLVLPSQIDQKLDEKDEKFLKEETWINERIKEYPGQLIAYRKNDEGFELLAHSYDERDVIQKINQLIQDDLLPDSEELYFRKL